MFHTMILECMQVWHKQHPLDYARRGKKSQFVLFYEKLVKKKVLFSKEMIFFGENTPQKKRERVPVQSYCYLIRKEQAAVARPAA